MDTPRDLNKLVQLIREISAHEIPVLVKLGAGQVYNDVRIAINSKPDGIILDSSTSSAATTAGDVIADTAVDAIGIPPLGVLAPMAKAIVDGKAAKNDVRIIFAGDLESGADIFKVMAFGASAVILSTAPLAAAGIGPGTNPASRSKFDPASAGVRIAQFLGDRLTELKALTAWTGHDSVFDADTDSLRAVNYNTAAITGLKLIGYEKTLTMWEH
jgi:glutamate synthase domain-containing protein 2